jgi:gliding motility-associated-like protein
MSMKKQLIILASFCFILTSSAQGLYLKDGELTVQNTATVTIQGDLSSETLASIDNLGTFRVRDNIINNGSNVLFTSITGGKVILYGNNQLITGVDSTVFYDLDFAGNALSEKSFLTPSSVLNELNINNQILQTNANRVYLLNPSTTSLLFGDGFIASDELGGYFVRSTESTDEYVFPVGAIGLTPYYRAVAVSPLSAQNNLFEVRLAPLSASIDNSGTSASGAVGPFDINQKVPDLGPLNQLYYHNIHNLTGGSSADIDVYWSSLDGNYTTLAQWVDTQFENPLDELTIANYLGLDQVVSLKNFNDYNDDVFVLAEADTTTIPEEPCPDFYIPSIFSPNGDLNNDQFCVFWGCYTDVYLSILNRWGEIIFETEDPLECWNGEQKGEPMNTGIFVYMIKVSDPDTGEELLFSGNLTLAR